MTGLRWMIAGAWSVNGTGGIGIYRYDETTGEAKLLRTVREDIVAGFLLAYPERNLLYAVDEREDNPDQGMAKGTGGRVFAFRLDPATGELSELNRRSSLGPLPAYITDDGTGEGIVAACHGTDSAATRAVRDTGGRLVLERVYSESPIVHYPLREDGSLGEPDDCLVPGAAPEMYSCMHSANLGPDGRTIIACDRNLDRVYRLQYDPASHRLSSNAMLQLEHGTMKTGACPRYSTFHPTLPVVYVNSEYGDRIFVISLAGSGLELICEAHAAPPGLSPGAYMPSDIMAAPDGRRLYMLYRKSQQIGVFHLDPEGIPHMVQCLKLPGEDPRGMRFSPDGRFILVAERKSDDIVTLAVDAEGMAEVSSICRGQKSPGNMVFM